MPDEQIRRLTLRLSMPYSPSLDGVRAIAVLMVLAFHARAPGSAGGFLGVDVFFVLSGYLITRLLTAEHGATGTINIPRFYARRLARLYPALLVMLVAYLIVARDLFGVNINHARDAAIAATYLSDYARAFWGVPEVLQHTWSLAVEEHFYLLWAPVLLLLLRLERFKRGLLLIALYILATAWRVYVADGGAGWAEGYYLFDTRLSGLILGAACATFQLRLPGWAGAAGLSAVLLSMTLAEWRSGGGLGIWMIIAELGAVALVASADRLPGLGCDTLAWLGRMSYGIYLWHYPIVYWLRTETVADWFFTIIIAGPISVACAAISYYTVEAAFRRKNRRAAAQPADSSAAHLP